MSRSKIWPEYVRIFGMLSCGYSETILLEAFKIREQEQHML